MGDSGFGMRMEVLLRVLSPTTHPFAENPKVRHTDRVST
jgi:hypothetical protein